MNTNTGLGSHSRKNPGGRICTARFVKRDHLACYDMPTDLRMQEPQVPRPNPTSHPHHPTLHNDMITCEPFLVLAFPCVSLSSCEPFLV